MSNVVKSISYDQHEILYNIMQLHNGGKSFECDPTFSKGCFYGTFVVDGEQVTIDVPKHKFDVYPQTDDTVKLDVLGSFPIEDGSVSSIVIDLPFIISPHNAPSVVNDDGTKNNNIIFKRFSSFYPVSEMFETYTHFLNEAYRVLSDGGICVFKTQNNISGGKFICTEEYSWVEAQKCGFHVIDRFTLLAKTRLISGKVKNQQHARNYSSVFWVFKKDVKHKKVDYYLWQKQQNQEN